MAYMTHSRWQPPRFHKDYGSEEERKVAWLELFYDLVYVAAIIQLGNLLSGNVSVQGALIFAALFVPIWWSWTGMTFYTNRFVADDVWHRLLIFTQMFFIAVLAVSVDKAISEEGRLFTLAYVGIRLILVLLYFRAGRHVPHARPLTNRYAWGFLAAAMIWLVGAFVPPPYRYLFWAAGMVADFAVPLSSGRFNALLPPDVPHMVERYGIFTIIVLGESFVKVVSSAGGVHLEPPTLVLGFFGLIIAASLWWLYFDDVARATIRPVGRAPYVWIYSHLPVAIGLTAYGVGITKLVLLEPGHELAAKYRWLLCGALMLFLVFVALIDLATARPDRAAPSRTRASARFISALVLALLAGFGGAFPPIVWIALVTLVCAAPIIVDLLLERKERESHP